MTLIVSAPDDQGAKLYADRNSGADEIAFLANGTPIYAMAHRSFDCDDPDWLFVHASLTINGWIKAQYVADTSPQHSRRPGRQSASLAPATNNRTVDNSAVHATARDILILARTLYGEASSESVKGIEAVAGVVVNRALSRYRGETVEQVCLTPRQFSCWNRDDPNYWRIKDQGPGKSTAFDRCYWIARDAVGDAFPYHFENDDKRETRHYHATYIPPPYWVTRKAVVTLREGNHIFYKGVT